MTLGVKVVTATQMAAIEQVSERRLLAALFDWGRKMFESAKAIREAQKARMVKKAREDEQKRIRKELERHGVTLAPEVAEAVFSNPPENAS